MRYIPNLSFWRYLFLTELPFLTIDKANILSKFMCMTGLFPCPSEKKKYTIIRLTEMSQIFGTENFLEDANMISGFFFVINSGTSITYLLILLISFHRSPRNFAISHTGSIYIA